MREKLQSAQTGSRLSEQSLRRLVDTGFVVIRGPLFGDQLTELAAAYDKLMAAASGFGFKIGSTTTRMSDLLNFGPAFDEIFLHPPLYEACLHLIGEPFKLSSFLARTLRPHAPAQELHADLLRSSKDAPLIGFIFMIDPFRPDNGATRFVPFSHDWPDLPSDRLPDAKGSYPGEVLGCGEPGSMIIFNGAVWHGHTANMTLQPRRSIQGYFVKRNARSETDFSQCLQPETKARMSFLARHLLAIG